MRSAYSILFLVSFLLLGGCANYHKSGLPNLRNHQSHLVVQVASNFDASIKRDYSYFIICSGSDCPEISIKTPLHQMPVIAGQVKQQKGRTVDGVNTTYLKKTSTVLDQFRVHFDYASATVSDVYQSLLKSFVDTYPHHQSTLRVTGFTDSGSKPDGTVGNEWLALERATSVKQQLISLGYPESQVLLEAKFLCCYIDSNESEAGRRNNRRAEISLITTQHN